MTLNADTLACLMPLVFGLIFLLVACLVHLDGKNKRSKWDLIDVLITKVKKSSNAIYVDYEYLGKYYSKVRYNYSTPFMRVGNTVKAYINPNVPDRGIVPTYHKFMSLLFGILGLVAILFGILLLLVVYELI